jgi:transposase
MSTFFGLLADCPGLRLDDVFLTPTAAVALVASTAPTGSCPVCHTPSDRVHSHYRRTVADLPCHGRPVALRLLVRRFRCANPACPRLVFCERLGGLLGPRARSTTRLTDAHRAVGFALGGEAGARLADELEMPTSADTLLRRVKSAPAEQASPPRHVGVDDWAMRKGHRYGTILIDLERGRVIDLLPGRDGVALKAWLLDHPSVELITRDRWAAFARAAAEGAPQAQQVADRWHLLKNLREAVERLLERRYPAVKNGLESADAASAPGDQQPPAPSAPLPPAPTEPPPAPPPTPRARARQAKRQRRVERYHDVRERHRQGQSARGIARELKLSVRTVLRYLRQGDCPDWRPGRTRSTRLERFGDHIDRRIQEGCQNAAQLYRELAALGCQGSSSSVRQFISRRLAAAGRTRQRANAARPPPPPPPPSAKSLSFELLKRAKDRKAEEQARVERLQRVDAELTEALELAAAFQAMARKETAPALSEWLERAEKACPEIRRFAEGVRQDEAAVAAALSGPWSNGPVEGQVNRLKAIKRQMYGRAGLALLRARVVHAG